MSPVDIHGLRFHTVETYDPNNNFMKHTDNNCVICKFLNVSVLVLTSAVIGVEK